MQKINFLLVEIVKAKEIVDESKKAYLDNYKKGIENIVKQLENDTLPASNGGVMGVMRGISEYDSLAIITPLYDAAYDVDLYYSNECKEW